MVSPSGNYIHSRLSGSKRSIEDFEFDFEEDDEDHVFPSTEPNLEVEETYPSIEVNLDVEETVQGMDTGIILSLRESLQNCKDTLAACKTELEAERSEIQRWHSSFKNEASLPEEPGLVANYLQSLKSSTQFLTKELEKKKRKEAAFMVTFPKREREISELKSIVRRLKSQLNPASMQARKLLFHPSIHKEFTRLKNLLEEKEEKIKMLQENLIELSFTPVSREGKMLIAKCRSLQEENDMLQGALLDSDGKVRDLGLNIALQKEENATLISQCEGICMHLDGLRNDMERSNEMVLALQERVEEKDSEIERLRSELKQKEV